MRRTQGVNARVAALSGKSRWLSVALACAPLCTTALASAQSPAADDGSAYQRVIEEALQEFNIGNWDEAVVLFERAHTINPSARTERGIGMAAFEARHYVSAIPHLSAALTEQRNPLTAAQREEVQRALNRAHAYVARLVLDVLPPYAQIRVNGSLATPDARSELLIDPGLQELEISAAGHEPLLRRIHVVPSTREPLVLRLKSSAPRAATEPAPGDNPLSTWKWVAGAGGLAFTIVGSVSLIMQKSEASRYNRMCDPTVFTETCATIERNAGGLWYAGAIIGLGLGAGLLSTSALLFMLDNAEPRNDHAVLQGCRVGVADIGVMCGFAL